MPTRGKASGSSHVAEGVPFYRGCALEQCQPAVPHRKGFGLERHVCGEWVRCGQWWPRTGSAASGKPMLFGRRQPRGCHPRVCLPRSPGWLPSKLRCAPHSCASAAATRAHRPRSSATWPGGSPGSVCVGGGILPNSNPGGAPPLTSFPPCILRHLLGDMIARHLTRPAAERVEATGMNERMGSAGGRGGSRSTFVKCPATPPADVMPSMLAPFQACSASSTPCLCLPCSLADGPPR